MFRHFIFLILLTALHAQETIAVTDVEKLKANLEKVVTVVGVPNEQSTSSKDGHQFLHFDSTTFEVFCFKAVVAEIPQGQRPLDYKGKKVQVTGKITTYKNHPQIMIRKADQIKLVVSEPPTPAPEKKVDEKKED